VPVVLRVGRYKFSFFAGDKLEPPHIHAKAGGNEAKFWLDSIQLVVNHGFKPHELNEIEKIVKKHQTLLQKAWRKYFDEK